jgi:hypothetical protein
MRYFKRRWEELRGDSHDDWGHSWWYFEVDGAGQVVRQLEAYDAGEVRKYDQTQSQDSDGWLSKEFDMDDAAAYLEIAAAEFNRRWAGTVGKWGID